MTRRLLFDQNLSSRAARELEREFPGSRHVSRIKLGDNSDAAIWAFAKENGYCIVSKDSDFHQMSFLYGAPPKAIWVRMGNCSTSALIACIHSRQSEIAAFLDDVESAFLVLS